MAITEPTPKLNELIERLDKAVESDLGNECCPAVKSVLEDVVRSGEDFVPESYMRPNPDRYARRLLHRDPQGRYSVLVMVWDVGQGTPLHDHAGSWCVECVYRGRIKVDSYSAQGNPDGEFCDFTKENTIHAGFGEAGALIPPLDFHTIANADDAPAVTIHVYAGEMEWCNVYLPLGDTYKRERRQLSYTD
jgi:3-mercaptopropionate dioxygenase